MVIGKARVDSRVPWMLTSTMTRHNRVGTEQDLARKAGEQLEGVTDEEERFRILQSIRQVPSSMAIKRQLMEKLMAGPVKNLHGVASVRFENKKRLRKLKEAWNSFKYTMEPWGHALQKIEGHHGAGVVSYFVFLRYLLLVNVCLFLLTMFIWVPEVIFSSNDYTSGSTAATCTASYNVNISSDGFTLILDFFQGTGWLEQTMVFYGYYSGNGLSGSSYKLSLAYMLVCICCLISSLILMGRNVARSFRDSILNEGDGTTEFCNKVFGTWDYTLMDESSCEIKHKSIRYELLSDMHEQEFLREREKRLQKRSKKCKLYTMRIVINIFICLVLGAAAYCIYYVISFSTEYASDHSDASGTWNELLLLLVQFLPSITITVLNALLPILFEKVVVGEEYTAAFVIKITLIRTVFLRLASLAVLIITLYTEVTCSTQDSCNNPRSPCTQITCWETYVGQQFYKLIITDFLVVIFKTLLVELPRRLLYDKCSCGLMQKVGPPEFDIPANVLDLVYTQCLYWLALTFAPLTPSFSVVKSILTFYLKMLSALKACPPAEKPARAARTNHFFMIILLIAFFLCSVPVGFVFYNMSPSQGCGPFRTYSKMYYALTTTVDSWPSTAESIYELITSPAITGPVIIFLILMIYYCSTLANAHKDMSDLFREQLVMLSRSAGDQQLPKESLKKQLESLSAQDRFCVLQTVRQIPSSIRVKRQILPEIIKNATESRQHGPGIVSFFEFLRYLLLVNVCLCLIACFILVPGIALKGNPYPPNSTAAVCTARYTTNDSTDSFLFMLDLVKGTGYMERTWLFYGYYAGNGLEGTKYKFSLAYYLVCVLHFLVSVTLMGR
nr:hypothetical protein BaRGS_002193 [Batillaria attramentaria]